MKYLLIFLPFLATHLKGQSPLTFDHRFVESENKWVVIRTDKDTVMNFGFIYIDAAAGLTLSYEGSFTIAKDGKFIPKKLDNFGIKYRLKPNNVRVAFIPSTKYNELEITEYPDWLKIYSRDTTSIEHLYRWGFLYNSYNECAKALTYLDRAQKINPKFKGLEVELAFSYNCLNKFDEAISVLTGAIETNPTDAYFYKELSYAQINLKQFDKAIETCKKALSVCTDTKYHTEICYNLLHELYVSKDKKRFHEWLATAKNWCKSQADLTDSIKTMEEDLAK
ncbi:tetratricopeptide repeat protein [Ferruginibacter profundus]